MITRLAQRVWVVRGGSLTGARVVLEGAHTVSMGRERAHMLPCVCEPALDGPVGAARVDVPVHELRRRDIGPAGCRPSKPLSECKGRACVVSVHEPECPCLWVPP